MALGFERGSISRSLRQAKQQRPALRQSVQKRRRSACHILSELHRGNRRWQWRRLLQASAKSLWHILISSGYQLAMLAAEPLDMLP